MDEITRQEYQKEVQELAESIKTECREYGRDVSDALHETIDGHQWVIYTYFNFQVLQHSENDGYALENFGTDCALTESGALNTAALAYGALYGDVSEALNGWNGPDDDDDDTASD